MKGSPDAYDLQAIIDIMGHQRHRDNPLRVVIEPEMRSAPGAAPAGAMRLDNHSPASKSPNPVQSTHRCTGSSRDGGRAMANVSARRLNEKWLDTTRPSRRMTNPISRSV